jgi:cytochrome c
MKVLAVLLLLLFAASPALAELRGHGGPVRAVAVSPDGATVLSGSFDQSAILWSPERAAALAVLRAHEGAVNAVTFLPDGRFATAGEEGRIVLWRPGAAQPERVFEGHGAKIAALAASPDGRFLVSAAWDRTVRLWPLDGSAPRVFEGHTENAVNAVGVLGDASAIVSAGYDGTLRLWPLDGSAPKVLAEFGLPQNTLAVLPAGAGVGDAGVAVAGADGTVRLVPLDGGVVRELTAGAMPVITLAVNQAGTMLAAGGIRGSVSLWSLPEGRLLRTLSGPGLPVWAAAFAPDGTLYTGGTDRRVRRWNAVTGAHLGAVAPEAEERTASSDHPGARVWRACAACHTLTGDSANRAGPSLAGLFGRRIATVPDFAYSEALRGMDIVWTRETVAALFTQGPAAYTPGTRMPEQTVGNAEDLNVLLDFLEIETRK